ncbi:acyl-CoA dehydrogenase family protein [Streptomyces sp. NBC_01142]|uniref:acyl-CoA dehydrogenase family protein n=1 Tax=Streptomyces sp. NBC_01142 TaxID=2975865 RepID=UPI00224F6608|nr:acyl-CoA dehydrogenase family protein [Streptomyces sp. NBC_01142]MCX4820778.1 acyl-CoA dehydrogenase family protein [Streptomyces sp. NBC_01142]
MNLTELFHEELNPVLRRLGARAKGAGQELPDEEDSAVRHSVWSTLAELGGLRPALAPRLGGPADAMAGLVETAELMGPALYQSPFLDTMIAADLLAGDGRHDPLLAEIAAGHRTIALAVREQGTDEPSVPRPIALDADRGVVGGTRRFVAFAAEVDFLLVIGEPGHALVPVEQPGVVLHRHDDIGRGDLYRVTFDAAETVADGVLAPGPRYPAALARGRLLQAAYLAGLSRGALELTVERLKKRTAFDRPLAKQQAPAYRLAAMAAEATAVMSLVRAVAGDADSGADIRLASAQALFLSADLARQVSAEAVHLHGAAGLTEEHDVSVFYRRAAVDAVRLGTPTQLRREAAQLLAAAYDSTTE